MKSEQKTCMSHSSCPDKKYLPGGFKVCGRRYGVYRESYYALMAVKVPNRREFGRDADNTVCRHIGPELGKMSIEDLFEGGGEPLSFVSYEVA